MLFHIKSVSQLAILARDINVRKQNTIRFYCKIIRMAGIEKDNGGLKIAKIKAVLMDLC